MQLPGEFHVELASDDEHQRVYAEIYHNGLFVALVSQENERGQLTVETPGPNLVEDLIVRKVDLAGFQKALALAAARLQGR